MILTVTANPCIDVTVFANKEHTQEAGGKGVNVARVLQNLGAEALALTYGDAPFATLMQTDGIPCALVPREVRVITTHVATDGMQTVDMQRGLPLTQEEADALYDMFLLHMPQAEMVVVSGALPGPLARMTTPADAIYTRISAYCVQHDLPVWLDMHGPGTMEALAQQPAFWKPNEHEWTAVTGQPASPEAVQAWLQAQQLNTTVLLSLGEQGAACITCGEIIRQASFAVPTVNAVGSGDCFTAAYVYRLLQGDCAAACLRYACAAGAANAAVFAAATVGVGDVERVLGTINSKTKKQNI